MKATHNASSTEEKIKSVAKKLFTEKGFKATTTRDIAEQANINPALVNYYFRSKEKLFALIMKEKFFTFFGTVLPVFNDEKTSIAEKIEIISDKYFNMLSQNPDLPSFVLNEIRRNPENFANQLAGIDFIKNSVFTRQLKDRNPSVHPENLLINLLSLNIFPFIMQPALQVFANRNTLELQEIMTERKAMIPLWTQAMLDIKPYQP